MSKHNNIKISIFYDVHHQIPTEIWEMKWSELKKHFLNFWGAVDKLAGLAWSPAILTPGTARNSKNVEGWSVVALNFNGVPYGPVRARLKEIGWTAVAHSTFSHSNDVNHFRVVIRLNRPLRRWEAPAIHQFVNSQLGWRADLFRTHAPVYIFPIHHTRREDEAFSDEFFGSALNVEHVWKWLESEKKREGQYCID